MFSGMVVELVVWEGGVNGWESGCSGVDGVVWGYIICFLGMAFLDNKAIGRMGMRVVVYYMVITVIVVFIGIFMVIIIYFGKGFKEGLYREGRIEIIFIVDVFMDLVR